MFSNTSMKSFLYFIFPLISFFILIVLNYFSVPDSRPVPPFSTQKFSGVCLKVNEGNIDLDLKQFMGRYLTWGDTNCFQLHSEHDFVKVYEKIKTNPYLEGWYWMQMGE